MTLDNLNGTPYAQKPRDEEVEDGEIEDDMLVDEGTLQETVRTKVHSHDPMTLH